MHSYDQENQDDFGLPEVKYEPLDREDETPPEFEEPAYYEDQEEEEPKGSKKGLIIIGIISLLIIAGLSIYLFLFGGVEQISGWFADEPEPQPVTQVVSEPEPEPEPTPEPEPAPEPEPEIDPLAPYSDISAISEPTGRSFIVVGSFVDADLAMDYSQELMEQGVGSRILSPTNRAPLMHRVAVADYDSFQEAMNDISLFRNKYGEQTWVLKY